MEKKLSEAEREAGFERLLKRLKQDPKFELRAELGKLLMRHIDSFTPEEKLRYNELIALLKD